MTFIRSVQEGRATLEETLQLGIAKVLGEDLETPATWNEEQIWALEAQKA